MIPKGTVLSIAILTNLCICAHALAGGRLPIRAAIKLDHSLCETTSVVPYERPLRFATGKTVCDQLEPALRQVFSDLIRVEGATAPPGVQVILAPHLAGITNSAPSFTKRRIPFRSTGRR